MAARLFELWKTLKAAAGIKWQLLGVLVSLVVARADWINKKLVQIEILPSGTEDMIFGFPSWILGFASALAFLFAWMFAYAHKLRRQIQISRVELSKLRKRGVALRNEGKSLFSSNSEFLEWSQNTKDWHKEVYESLKKISEADAEWFETLDVVPQPRIPLLNSFITNTQIDRYRQLDFQVRRLGEMIRELWGK